MKISEQKLIQQVLDGDMNSFSRLIELHQNTLSCYLLTQTNNKEDAEDILQETFISAHKYLRSYNSQWKFKTWLFTISKRLLYKHYKKNKYVDVSGEESFDTINDVLLDKNNIWTTIKKHVNSKTFEILWFHYAEELTVKEIAEILKCTQSRVKMNLFRSKRKLAKIKEIESLFNDIIVLG